MSIHGYENLDPSPGDDWDVCFCACGPEHKGKYAPQPNYLDCECYRAAKRDQRLIDAAPELLAACKAIVSYIGGETEFIEAVRLCRAAIAHAEGRTP